MRLNKYEIFQHIYFEMQDLIAYFMQSGYITYCDKSNQYTYNGTREALDGAMGKIFEETQLKFSLSKKMTQNYRTVFADVFESHYSYMNNRLFFSFFCPIIMSPMVMMFLAARVAFYRFKTSEMVSLDLIFEDVLLAYNSILSYPLSKDIINSMITSFQNDDGLIKSRTDGWIQLILQSDSRNKGFIWHNNGEHCMLADKEKTDKVFNALYQRSYLSPKNLLSVVSSYKFKKDTVLNVRNLRSDMLGFYYATLVDTNKDHDFDFCGVGVPQLLLQGMVNSLYLIGGKGDRVYTKHILSVEKGLGFQGMTVEEDTKNLLEFAQNVLAREFQQDLSLADKIVSNHGKIISLIKAPSFFKGLADYNPTYPTK